MRSGKQSKRQGRAWGGCHAAKRASAKAVRRAVRSVLRAMNPADFDGTAFPVVHQSWDDAFGTVLDAGRPCCVVNLRAEQELDQDAYWADLDDQELREDARWGWTVEQIRAIEIEDAWFDLDCEARAEKMADLDRADYETHVRWNDVIFGEIQIQRWLAGFDPEDLSADYYLDGQDEDPGYYDAVEDQIGDYLDAVDCGYEPAAHHDAWIDTGW